MMHRNDLDITKPVAPFTVHPVCDRLNPCRNFGLQWSFCQKSTHQMSCSTWAMWHQISFSLISKSAEQDAEVW